MMVHQTVMEITLTVGDDGSIALHQKNDCADDDMLLFYAQHVDQLIDALHKAKAAALNGDVIE